MAPRGIYSIAIFVVLILTLSNADEITPLKDEIENIKKLIGQQNEKIVKLESENEVLKIKVEALTEENKFLKTKTLDLTKQGELLKNEVLRTKESFEKENNSVHHSSLLQDESGKPSYRNIQTKGRRLLVPTSVPVEPIAFYAYMSKTEATPSNHHTLIFDVTKTNLGNGYNKYSGTFVAPTAGAYVFTWTINTNPHGAHFVNLMVNNAVVGGTLTDTQEANDFDSDSSTVVVSLNSGDSVNLRTTSASDRAEIYVDIHAFTCFSGWKI